jgi:hypothetical protein
MQQLRSRRLSFWRFNSTERACIEDGAHVIPIAFRFMSEGWWCFMDAKI